MYLNPPVKTLLFLLLLLFGGAFLVGRATTGCSCDYRIVNVKKSSYK